MRRMKRKFETTLTFPRDSGSREASAEDAGISTEEDPDHTRMLGRDDPDHTRMLGREDPDHTHMLSREGPDHTHMLGREDPDHTRMLGREDPDHTHMLGREHTDCVTEDGDCTSADDDDCTSADDNCTSADDDDCGLEEGLEHKQMLGTGLTDLAKEGRRRGLTNENGSAASEEGMSTGVSKSGDRSWPGTRGCTETQARYPRDGRQEPAPCEAQARYPRDGRQEPAPCEAQAAVSTPDTDSRLSPARVRQQQVCQTMEDPFEDSSQDFLQDEIHNRVLKKTSDETKCKTRVRKQQVFKAKENRFEDTNMYGEYDRQSEARSQESPALSITRLQQSAAMPGARRVEAGQTTASRHRKRSYSDGIINRSDLEAAMAAASSFLWATAVFSETTESENSSQNSSEVEICTPDSTSETEEGSLDTTVVFSAVPRNETFVIESDVSQSLNTSRGHANDKALVNVTLPDVTPSPSVTHTVGVMSTKPDVSQQLGRARGVCGKSEVSLSPSLKRRLAQAAVPLPVTPTTHSPERTQEKAQALERTKETKASERTKEKAQALERTQEKAQASERTKETKASERTQEKAQASERTQEKAQASERTKETKASERTQEKAQASKRTQEKAQASERTQEKVRASERTKEKVKDKERTEEKVKVSYKTQEKVKASERTQEKVKVSERIRENAKAKERTQGKVKAKERTKTRSAEKPQTPILPRPLRRSRSEAEELSAAIVAQRRLPVVPRGTDVTEQASPSGRKGRPPQSWNLLLWGLALSREEREEMARHKRQELLTSLRKRQEELDDDAKRRIQTFLLRYEDTT